MDRARPTRLRFGPFEADLASRQLYESGVLVPIQGKPFQFLAALLRQYGQTVSREAISHALWPDIYVQVNQGLNAAARKVRMVLRDDAMSPVFIQTLGSKGYRFIHPTEVIRWSSEVTALPETAIRIAFLPLKAANQENAIFAEGLNHELASQLGRLHKRLTVLPIEHGKQLAGNDLPESVREAIDIQYVLSGTFSLQAGRVELGITMSNPDGRSLWTECYEGPNHSLPEMQVQIAERVLQTFPILSPASPVPAFKTKFSAYQEYLKGRQHQGRHEFVELQEAMSCFKRATELDSSFGPAYVGMSEVYNVIGVRGWMEPKCAYAQALQMAKRAIELDPDNPDAMSALGWAYLAGHRDWAMATRLFERALQVNPNSTLGYCYYSYLLFTRGRADDGVASLEKAHEIDPSSLFINSRLTAMYYFARRYDEAIKQARTALAVSPENPHTRTYLGLSFIAQRRFPEAVEELQAAVEHSHGDPITVAQLAYAQAQAGHFPLAQALLQKIENTDGRSAAPSYHIALVNLALGNVNGAFDWLDAAYEQCWHWVLLTPHDPRFDILRGTRRFENLCRSLRPVEARKVANSIS